MTAALFAGLSALVYGVGDYCGGTAGKRASALAVTLVAKSSALPLLIVLAVVLGADRAPDLADLGWAAAAGLAGVFGVVLFYRAMSTGAMAVVAPITAAATAVLPVVVGIAVDGSPGLLPLLGVGCAVVAITLVSAGGGKGRVEVTPGLIGVALVSGLAFGLFFALLDRARTGTGQWPLVAAQLAATTGLLVVGRGRGLALTVPRGALRFALAAGVLDTMGNVLYVVANNGGELALVAPLASLYPASTVLLALLVDRERVRGWQLLGLGLAGTALALLAATG